MSDYFDEYFGMNEDDSAEQKPVLDAEYHESEDEPEQTGSGYQYDDSYRYTDHNDYGYSGGAKPPKKPRHNNIMRTLCVILVVLILCGTVGKQMGQVIEQRIQETTAQETETDTQKSAMEIETETSAKVEPVQTTYNGSAALTDVSDIVENVAPSIVSINCNIVQTVQDFFGRTYTQEGAASGSGIIIGQNSESVLIVTNNHVVADAREVSVEFGNGESVDASIVGTSSNYDLAVISVKTADIPEETYSYIRVAAIGDSDALRVGEMAIAYGNALGYGPTVTVGYISALNRQVSYEDFSMELIQTDAAINPGNSGGALLNARGEVIGINSVKYSSTEVEGVGFAIPITDALPVIDELMNQKQTVSADGEAYLGVVPYTVTEQYASQFHMPIGVYVSEVADGSPAQRAGIQMGDIITEIQGRSIESSEELAEELAGYAPGDTVSITVQRVQSGNYVERTLTATLGRR